MLRPLYIQTVLPVHELAVKLLSSSGALRGFLHPDTIWRFSLLKELQPGGDQRPTENKGATERFLSLRAGDWQCYLRQPEDFIFYLTQLDIRSAAHSKAAAIEHLRLDLVAEDLSRLFADVGLPRLNSLDYVTLNPYQVPDGLIGIKVMIDCADRYSTSFDLLTDYKTLSHLYQHLTKLNSVGFSEESLACTGLLNQLHFNFPVILGHLSAGINDLYKLKTGDAVLINQPFFNLAGLGTLYYGACALPVRWHNNTLVAHGAVHWIERQYTEQNVLYPHIHAHLIQVRSGFAKLTLNELHQSESHQSTANLSYTGYLPQVELLYAGQIVARADLIGLGNELAVRIIENCLNPDRVSNVSTDSEVPTPDDSIDNPILTDQADASKDKAPLEMSGLD